MQLVVVAGQESSKSTVNCGVPRGSVLWSILFLLYLTMIVHNHGLDVHSYADDNQLHFLNKLNSWPRCLPRFTVNIDKIDKWMSASLLTRMELLFNLQRTSNALELFLTAR